MRTGRPLLPPLVALLAVTAIPVTTGQADAAQRTIHLLCGAAATPCAQDPNVTFTSNTVLSPHQAVVGTGAPGNPCEVWDDLNKPGKSNNITTTNPADISAEFKTTFSLPGNFPNVMLDIQVKVDDVGRVILNGNQIAEICKTPNGPQLVYQVVDANPAHFQPGTNTLVFQVVNNPASCAFVPAARGGPGDAMNLQFEGAVTYDAPPVGGGLNFGWDDCGGLPASLNKTFACNTNVGTNTLVGSFLAPCCVTGMSANEVVINLQSPGGTLPAWWVMRVGGCRQSSLAGNFDFTAGPFTCQDYWQGGAIGSLSMQAPVGNRTRILGVFALPQGDPRITGILEGTEVYSFKMNINNAKSTGLGACAGCGTGVCLVLNSIKINQPVSNPFGSKWIANPATRAYATWQGGIGGDCYAATPATNVTWGKLKATYR